MKIEIYYDGTNIKENSGDEVAGFTTNISFLLAAGVDNYDSFIRESLKHSAGRPISFQLYDDDNEGIERMARKITSYDDSVFVKIPVMKTNESPNAEVIKKLHNEGVQVNVTAIFTNDQLDTLDGVFNKETRAIISIFGGRINDCGHSSADIVGRAREMFQDYPNVKILWAACRTVYNVLEAQEQGADIVTVPDSVLNRLHRLTDNPYEAGVKAVKQFRADGVKSGLVL